MNRRKNGQCILKTNGRPGDALAEDSQDDSFSGGSYNTVYPKTNGRPGDTLAEDSQDDSFSGGRL